MSDYAKGFKDGFLAGFEEGKKLSQNKHSYEPWPSTSPNISLREICPKCGIRIDSVMGYVCGSINCPAQYKVTSDVGASTGANGPAGSLDSGLGDGVKWYR